MPSIPGIENLSPAVKYVIAFAIIFVLLALFALILRRLTGGRMSLSSDRGRARQPRLGIVDVYDLDRQRQLILLRRDNVEHLLLVGGPNDVVVETNIVRVPGARLPVPPADNHDRAEPGHERNVEIAPVRPVVEPSLARFTERGQDFVAARLEANDALASIVGPAGGDAALKPTRVVAAPSTTAPSMPAPPVRTSAPRPNLQPPSRNGNGQDRPPPGDMTRQLEAALRRPPAAPIEPARAPAPEPVQQRASEPPAPVQPAPSPPRPRPPEPPRPAPQVPVAPQPPAQPQPAAQPQPQPPPPAKTSVAPPPAAAPPPQAAPPPAQPAPPPAAEPAEKAAAAATKPDPFSIEDIEAEFARLLGRPLDKKD